MRDATPPAETGREENRKRARAEIKDSIISKRDTETRVSRSRLKVDYVSITHGVHGIRDGAINAGAFRRNKCKRRDHAP